jgi:Domain of Unknown Function (DUF1540)
MTTMLEMPRVRDCAVFMCAYNQQGCHAFAITVGSDHAHCETFVEAPNKAGIESVIAQVGACKRADCRHNDGLECMAPAITVGPDQDTADCLTYELAG